MSQLKNIFTKTSGLICALFFVILTAQYALAAPTDPFANSITVLNGVNPQNSVVRSSVPQIIGTWINSIIGVLGIVALLYIVYSGFIYMTSQSHEDVDKAKKTMIYLAFGILILMSALAISTFVFDTLLGTGTSTTTPPSSSVYVAPVAPPAPSVVPAPAPAAATRSPGFQLPTEPSCRRIDCSPSLSPADCVPTIECRDSSNNVISTTPVPLPPSEPACTFACVEGYCINGLKELICNEFPPNCSNPTGVNRTGERVPCTCEDSSCI